MTRAPVGPRAVVVLLVLSIALMGCVAPGASADDLKGWQARPLPPDLSLAQFAVGQDVCRAGQPAGFAVRVLLQDRRTEWTAAFLVEGAGFTGSCAVSRGGNAGGSGRTDGREQFVGSIVVDERSSGSLGQGSGTLLGGRSAAPVATVLIDLPDGRTVEASVGGGYWLAWWPGESSAVRIRALNAADMVLATLDDSTPNWQQK